MVTECYKFYHFGILGAGLTTFNKINSAVKKLQRSFPRYLFLRIHEENVNLNFVLAVAPMLESKALYY